MVAPVEVGILLGPDDPDVSDRFAIDEVLLIGFEPLVQGFDGVELPAILLSRSHMMPPWLEATGDSIQHPKACLRFGLAGFAKGGAAGLIHRHAFGDEVLPTQEAVDQLAALAVLLEPGFATGLVV